MAELVELLFQQIELVRSQCDAIIQSYSASISNRTHQVIKTLGILAAIVAPLTFIV